MPFTNKLPARSATVLPRAASRAHRRAAARLEATTTHDGRGSASPGKSTGPDDNAAPDSTPRSVVSDLGTAHCCPNCGHTISVITLIVALDDEQPEQG